MNPAGHRPSDARSRPAGFAVALIALAAGLVYGFALSAPFVFDDQFAVVENPTIRHLGRVFTVLRPPPYAAGAAGRPLVNLSLALNYAFGGLAPAGYHALNLSLHVLAASALFGLLRRTLEKRVSGPSASQLALAIALLWTVHPLLTEAVTGVIQRDEILGSLFYLLTLYCFVRATELPAAPGWPAGAVAACACGMASKEIMVSAPLAVLLYDRTFVAGTFRAAWRRRRGLYLALAATWLVLAGCMLGSAQRGGTAGFGLGVSSWDYLLTQCHAIALYLKLSLWPHPLVIDYGTDLVTRLADVALPALALLLLAAGTVIAIARRSAWGFLGAGFLAILAPSSSVVPLVTQPIAEHRMYLPLAAVVAALVVGLHGLAGRRSLLVWPAAAVGLGALTIQRNADYQSEVVLTQGALAANPRNDRAYLNLGTFASRAGKTAEAIAYYRAALKLNPNAPDTHFNLAAVLEKNGEAAAALEEYRAAARLGPGLPEERYRLGLALARAGQLDAAIVEFDAARRLQPTAAAVRRDLAATLATRGNLRAQANRMTEAIADYAAALELDPRDARTHNNLANALAQTGRGVEAIAHYRAAVQAAPDYAEAHFNLALELLDARRPQEAAVEFAAVVRLRPDDAQARAYLAQLAGAIPK